jgi:hypothetical protein
MTSRFGVPSNGPSSSSISSDSVAEGRYALTEFARRKWTDPSGRVLPVLVRKTPLDTVPSYLKAVTILEPTGNIAAETSAAIDDMRQASRRVYAAWRVAANLSARYRYAIAIGTSCAVAALLAFVFSDRNDSSRFIAPAPAPLRRLRSTAKKRELSGP